MSHPYWQRGRFGHDLKKLWRAFKQVSNDPALAKFDGLISAVNKFEDLRYPRKGYVFSISLQKGTRPSSSGSATKGLRQYHLNLEEIDEFVRFLLTGQVTSEWIRSLLVENDAKSEYSRENLHSFI